jgi:hypothetical protein
MVTATAQPRSFSVWKALGLAAVFGVVAGLVIAELRRPPAEPDLRQAEEAAAGVLPTGAPLVRPETPKRAPTDFMEPDPRSLRGIPPYPGASPRRLHASHPAAQQTMAISWFETGDSVEDVLGFYERAFAEGKVAYTSHRFSALRGYVSWFEHDYSDEQPVFGKGLLHMVSVTREGEHTTVLVSVSEPQKILENLTPLPSGVRLPPGTVPQVMNLSELGQQRASVIGMYEFPRAQLIDDLLRVWKEDGWKLVRRTDGDDATTIQVVMNQRQQTAVIEGQGSTSQVVLIIEERPAEGDLP